MCHNQTFTAPSLLNNRHVLAAHSWKLALGCVSGNGSTCVGAARWEEGNETTLDDESDQVEASDDEEGPHWPSSESGTRRPTNRSQGRGFLAVRRGLRRARLQHRPAHHRRASDGILRRYERPPFPFSTIRPVPSELHEGKSRTEDLY